MGFIPAEHPTRDARIDTTQSFARQSNAALKGTPVCPLAWPFVRTLCNATVESKGPSARVNSSADVLDSWRDHAGAATVRTQGTSCHWSTPCLPALLATSGSGNGLDALPCSLPTRHLTLPAT